MPKGKYTRKHKVAPVTTTRPSDAPVTKGAGPSTITIDNTPIELTPVDLPITVVAFDPDNPRIQFERQSEPTIPIEELMGRRPDVRELAKSIKANGGLMERIKVLPFGKGREGGIAKEGNRRTAAYTILHVAEPDDPRWATIPAELLPDGISPLQVGDLLTDYHVHQKKTWGPFEKAGHVYHMIRDLGRTDQEQADRMGVSRNQVRKLLATYEFTKDRLLKAFPAKGTSMWSFAEELYKSPQLRDLLTSDPDFPDFFTNLVGHDQLERATDVRDLPKVLSLPEARSILDTGGKFDEAWKVVEAKKPEETSSFYRLLTSVKEACMSVPRDEFLRIREDPVAREKAIGAATELVKLLKDAGVTDLPIGSIRKAA